MRLKKIRLPHTLVLIYIIVILTVIATWIVLGFLSLIPPVLMHWGPA